MSLDSALGLAVADAPGGMCRFPGAERTAIERRAELDAGALRSRLVAGREAFVRRAGYRLDVVAGAEPLWPQGFDPLNVQVVAPGEVLHTRFVGLGNAAGAVEVLGDSAMTTAAGDHPLFSGLRSVALTGLVAEPVTEMRGDTVVVTAPGVGAWFRGAVVTRRDSMTIVTLRP